MNGISRVSESRKPSADIRGLTGGHHLPVSAASTLLLFLLLTFLPLQALGQDRQLGPVSADQTLWSIASQTRPDPSITVYQYMLALVDANPHAFAAGNVNLLREGVILDLPDAEFATRVSPEEARRRVEEQMQWYADLSRQELLEVLRSEPEPAPAERVVEPAEPAEPVAPVPEVIVEEQELVEEPEVLPEPEPVVAADEWADHEPIPERVEPGDSEQPLVSAEPLELEPLVQPSDPIAEPAPDMPEQLDAPGSVEETAEIGMPAPVVSEAEPMDWPADEPSMAVDETVAPGPAEPVSQQPIQPEAQQPAVAPPPLPATPPQRSVFVWLLIVVVVLGLAGFLAWWWMRRQKQSAPEQADVDELDEVDESSFPTAAAAAAAAGAGSGAAASSSPAGATEADAKPRGAGSDTWSGFEAAVIGGGPVPVGDPDPDSEPEAPEPPTGSDTVLTDEAPAGQKDADEVEASFKVEELGWFEDDGFSMDDSSSPEKSGAEQTDDIIGETDEVSDDLGETPPANVSFDDIDLASFRADQDADQESSDQDSSSSIPEDEFDLAEFREAPDPEPEPVDCPEPEFEQLPDLDMLGQPEEDAESEAEPASESEVEPEFDLKPGSEPELEDGITTGSAQEHSGEEATEGDELTDLSFDWDDELDSLSGHQSEETQPESQPGMVNPETAEASAPALDDDEAEVMLDLARLTADAGDSDYAHEVLDEIIATGSEKMAGRARELKGKLG